MDLSNSELRHIAPLKEWCSTLPSLQKLTLLKSPVCMHRRYREACILHADQLLELDGHDIGQHERRPRVPLSTLTTAQTAALFRTTLLRAQKQAQVRQTEESGPQHPKPGLSMAGLSHNGMGGLDEPFGAPRPAQLVPKPSMPRRLQGSSPRRVRDEAAILRPMGLSMATTGAGTSILTLLAPIPPAA